MIENYGNNEGDVRLSLFSALFVDSLFLDFDLGTES